MQAARKIPTTNQLVSSKREKSVKQTGCTLVAHKHMGRASWVIGRAETWSRTTDREATCLQAVARLREVHYGKAAGMRQSACEVEHQRLYVMNKHTKKQVIMPQSLKRHISHTWISWQAANTLHEWPLGGSTQSDLKVPFLWHYFLPWLMI